MSRANKVAMACDGAGAEEAAEAPATVRAPQSGHLLGDGAIFRRDCWGEHVLCVRGAWRPACLLAPPVG